MLVEGDAAGFTVTAGLTLARLLLQLFIGDFEMRKFVANAYAESVVRGEVALVPKRKVAEAAGVGVVLRNDRVEIVIGPAAGRAAAQSVVSPGILTFSESAGGVEGASGKDEVTMHAGLNILIRVDLDHAAHLAAILC